MKLIESAAHLCLLLLWAVEVMKCVRYLREMEKFRKEREKTAEGFQCSGEVSEERYGGYQQEKEAFQEARGLFFANFGVMCFLSFWAVFTLGRLVELWK